MPTIRQQIGCWLNERWQAELVLRAPGLARRMGLEWQDLCNRHETVSRCADGLGRVCHWRDSSLLTVCHYFPEVGARLLNRIWPACPVPVAEPVSIILPVRGADRLQSVAFVAERFLGVAGPESEVLVCEHAVTPGYARQWQPGIRHVLVPAREGEAFNKSKAMNAGARVARHPVLFLVDADVVPSPAFIAWSLEVLGRGWDAVRPVRFLFLLEEKQSVEFVRTGSLAGLAGLARVRENFPGGATVVRREAYVEIGGHDERFEGWGGEDLEFLDRLHTRRIYPGAFLPAIHLWHPPAEQKRSGHRNAELFSAIMREPVAARIERARRQPGWAAA